MNVSRFTHRNRMIAGLAMLFLLIGRTLGAETYPPKPEHYFNDYANVVSPNVAAQLDHQLDQFERDTSNQFVVAIFPKLNSESSVDDYSIHLFEAWKIGQKKKDNGVALFIYVQDRKLFINTGYGLEGALPDATAHQIIADEIAPRFKSGDYDGGVTAGVNAVIAATKGEYKGTGSTVHDQKVRDTNDGVSIGVIIAIFIAFIILRSVFGGYTTYGRYGRSGGYWGGGFGGGGFGGGGFGGGGGGGFSSGGGSTGGGGAGGSW